MSSPTVHAMLSPSSSHRWLVCTPSALLESTEPNVTSIYAEEGTDAHSLAELTLNYKIGNINETEFNTRLDNLKSTSKYYSEEFREYVDMYVNRVLEIMNETNAKLYLEERVYFEDIVPEGAGTSDAVLVGKDFIHIIDLKFGKGVEVSAIGNTQLRLYALGAIRKHLLDCNCQTVYMTIIQPRLDHISSDSISIEDLNKWALDYVKPRAIKAYYGEGEIVPGDHCKFCKRKGKCQQLADKQLSQAQAEFEEVVVNDNILEPSEMSPETLSKILTIAPKFIDWFKDVESYAMSQALNNELQIPGYKVVEGRSIRIITDKNAVKEILQNAGFAEEDYLKPSELLGISVLEKNIGKKLFNNLCEQYIIKPNGKPTLVPDSDSRPALSVNNYKMIGDEFDN